MGNVLTEVAYKVSSLRTDRLLGALAKRQVEDWSIDKQANDATKVPLTCTTGHF